MPTIPASTFTRLRRGATGFGNALRPAIRPLAIGGAVLAGGVAGREVLDAWARKENPPAQVGTITYTDPNLAPNDGSMRQEGYFFDPRTGRTFFFGAPAQPGSGPERSDERVTKTLILAGAAAILGFAFLTTRRR